MKLFSWLIIGGILVLVCGSRARGDILEGPIFNPLNGHFYYLLTQNSWTASEAEAVALGGHLASINNAKEDSFVYAVFSGTTRNLWIGLNDRAVEGVFEWTSGEPVTYTAWLPGQPDNLSGINGQDQDLVRYWANQGGWDDINDADSIALGGFGVVEVIPEPATATCLLPALAMLLGRVSRGRRSRSARGSMR